LTSEFSKKMSKLQWAERQLRPLCPTEIDRPFNRATQKRLAWGGVFSNIGPWRFQQRSWK
jgi:hypothetical protein